MDFDAIHHIAIICSDYAVAKDFYVNKLGLPIIRENYRPQRPSPEAYGLRHLAFCVKDVPATIEKLESLGIPCEAMRYDTFTGKRMTFFHDPDGLPLEIHE